MISKKDRLLINNPNLLKIKDIKNIKKDFINLLNWHEKCLYNRQLK